MICPLSEVLADVDRYLVDARGDRTADALLRRCRDLLAAAEERGRADDDALVLTHEEHERFQALIRGEGPPIPKRMIDLLRDVPAIEHNGPTWDPSSAVLLTLADAEALYGLIQSYGYGPHTRSRPIDALQHGIECAHARVDPPPTQEKKP